MSPHVSDPEPCGSEMKGEYCHLSQRWKNLEMLPKAGSDSSRQADPSPRVQFFAPSGEMGTGRWNLGPVSSASLSVFQGRCHVPLYREQWGPVCTLMVMVWGELYRLEAPAKRVSLDVCLH